MVRTRCRPSHDRLVVMVRDPYWLHAYWELNPRSVERAQSALGQHWHGTRPVLRVYRVAADGAAEMHREIPIHGGVNHWYVDVQNPPQQYRMEIGYLTAAGQFYCLVRSNTVTTPPAGTSDSVDENWADIDQNADRIFAMSGGYSQRGTSLELQELLEERLRRPMGNPMQTRYGGGAARATDGPAGTAVCRRCGIDRLWCHRSACPCHAAGRTGAVASPTAASRCGWACPIAGR